MTKTETPQPQPQAQQPQYQSQEPVPQNTPYQQQPVAQQYFAQPQAAPVQYVVAAKSLKGKGGWLAFFMVLAALASLGYVTMFFNAFSTQNIPDLIFAPLMFALALACVILIALEMKIAKWLYIGFWATTVVYSTVSSIVNPSPLIPDDSRIAQVLSGLIGGIVGLVLISLYFITSKRVKETLIK
jgi:hypothetical protein